MKKLYILVNFGNSKKSYYFYSEDLNLKLNDKVLVNTVVGKELGTVVSVNEKIQDLKFEKEIKPIICKASEKDIQIYNENKKLGEKAGDVFRKETEKLKLDMRLISSDYTFDKTKILFTYSSDDRVDFRELLKVLATELHCRIELRQINSRERAQSVGGLGSCGLQLCCTTFFKTFEGISINLAKNQMLALNIPKLSGQCGKLMCCLKYEDAQYTKLKEEFPKFGTMCSYQGKDYKICSYNVLTKVVKIENEDSIEFVKLSDLKIKYDRK